MEFVTTPNSFQASSKKTSDEMVVWYGSGHQKANKITLLFPPEWQILHFIELIEGYTTPTRNSLVNTLLYGNFILKAKANKKSNRSNVDHWLWEQEGDNQEYLSRFTKMFLQWLPGAFALKMKNISPKDLSGVRLISLGTQWHELQNSIPSKSLINSILAWITCKRNKS